MPRIIDVRFRVYGAKKLARYFRGSAKRATNLSGPFRWARRDLRRLNAANFASDGVASGKKWNALDTEYHAWKIRHHGGTPTMIRTGDLYRDLTTLSGSENYIGHKNAAFGTDLEYAKFHQTGTRFMPARKIVFAPEIFQKRLGNKIADHLVYGGNPASRSYRKMKSVAFRG